MSVPPRVIAAVFSTIWNRWTTHRRFQRRNLTSSQCLLGCGGQAEDSIEHYVNCTIVRAVAARFLNLKSHQVNLHTFVFCNPAVTTPQDMTAAALLIYASYTAFNYQRCHVALRESDVYDAMVQWVREGARGHSNATKVLQGRWQQRMHTSEHSGVTRQVRRRLL